MLESVYTGVRDRMQKTVELLTAELSKIRTSRPNPAILDSVKVEYYGSLTPIKSLAGISVPDPKQIVVQPYDRNALPAIEQAILKANLGLNPVVDGNLVRLPIPALTEERRKELVRLCHKLAEDARVAIRNIRREANEEIRRLERDKKISEDDAKVGAKKVQELTDAEIRAIDAQFERKQKEILEK
ncbi:MAG: ribosome recycling factor [candidate division WOR-3 bacterium]